ATSLTWMVGTAWKSAFSEFGDVFMRIMPTPPACLTARPLSVRPLTPRSQATILPATLAGSRLPPRKHSCAAVGSAPEAATSPAYTRPVDATASPMPGPVNVVPLPSVIDRVNERSWLLAATVVTHGELCATVDAVGPLLPADAAMKTPASAANMKETSTGST